MPSRRWRIDGLHHRPAVGCPRALPRSPLILARPPPGPPHGILPSADFLSRPGAVRALMMLGLFWRTRVRRELRWVAVADSLNRHPPQPPAAARRVRRFGPESGQASVRAGPSTWTDAGAAAVLTPVRRSVARRSLRARHPTTCDVFVAALARATCGRLSGCHRLGRLHDHGHMLLVRARCRRHLPSGSRAGRRGLPG